MTSRLWSMILTFFCVVSILSTTPPIDAQPLVVRIGVVMDGPWQRNDAVRELFQKEIADLLQGEFDVQFPEESHLVADWTIQGVKDAIDRLLADPKVDLVITSGVIASNDVSHRPLLPKPVVAPFVIDPIVQGLSRQADGSSGIKNLNYIALPSTFERDLKIFQEIAPYKKVAILLNKRFVDAIPGIIPRCREILQEIDASADILSIDQSIDEFLNNLPGDVEGVYVGPLIHLPEGEFEKLVSGLIEHKLPSFSLMGRIEVEQGLMACLNTDFFPRISRRIALNVQQILLGKDPGAIPVTFTVGERLSLNMATVRAINVWPSWAIMTEAELINQRREEIQRKVTLESSVHEALDVNLDLAAKDYFVNAGAQNVNQARSNLLPQLDISSSGVVIDKDRAGASFGAQAERTLTGSATLTQLIFSEPAWANHSIQRHIQNSRKNERNQLRFDIARDAAIAYLNVLRGKTFERIQKENVERTRTNLELARVREAVGYSGMSDVLRWESAIATSRKSIIEANSARNLAEIALNRILHRPLEEPFETQEVGLNDPSLGSLRNVFVPYISSQMLFREFRSFMAEEGIANAPELRALDDVIMAQERALSSVKRAFWTTSIALQGGVSNLFSESGAGTESAFSGSGFSNIPGLGDISIPEADETSWNVGVNLSFPLFTGGAKLASKNRAREELDQLRLERQAIAERIEQRTRSALHEAGASHAGISQSEAAAEAARKNLDIVVDAYSRGAGSIIELIDAQNAALTADLQMRSMIS